MMHDMTTNTSAPPEEVQDRLARALRFAGIGVGEMAENLGVSRTTVSNYLHGRSDPNRATLVAWAYFCAVDRLWLEHGDADDMEDAHRRYQHDTPAQLGFGDRELCAA